MYLLNKVLTNIQFHYPIRRIILQIWIAINPFHKAMRIAGSPRGQAVEVVYHMAGGNAHCSYDVVTYDATLGMSACPARLPHAAVMTPTSQIKLQQEGIKYSKRLYQSDPKTH